MFNNFKISPFVRLNLLANRKPTYISVFDIQQIYEDTSGKGQEGVRIIFPNDEYTFVEGPLDKVMYAIDEVLNPDFYEEAQEEESRRIPDVEKDAIGAARILKMFCKSKNTCTNCPFCSKDYECQVAEKVPGLWRIEEGEKNE